jgi:peptidoglycan hydrolase-like protein with peptidoglycan-binding domain
MKKILITGLLSIFLIFGSIQPAKAATIEELLKILQQLQAQLQVLLANQNNLSQPQSDNLICSTFTRDLAVGSTGYEVTQLQNLLEKRGFLIMPLGVAKGYFGPATQNALARYQSANGISNANGFLNSTTRAKINSQCSDELGKGETPIKVRHEVTVDNDSYKQLKISLAGGTRTNPVSMWTINIKCSAGINRIDGKGGVDCGQDHTFGNTRTTNGDATMDLDVYLNDARKDTERLDYTVKALDSNNREIGFTSDSIWVDASKTIYSVKVLSPNGGEKLSAGSKVKIDVTTNLTDKQTDGITLQLYRSYSNSNFMYVGDIERNWTRGFPYTWNVPMVDPGQYLIYAGADVIGGYKDGISDFSDKPFSIVSQNNITVTPPTTSTTTPKITVLSPNGNETLVKGETYRIRWSAPSNIDSVTLGYSFGPGSLNWIKSDLPNTGFYDWVVNVGNTSNTKVKIDILGYQTGTGSWSDQSDNFFNVIEQTNSLSFCTFNRDLTIGSSGDDVSSLQNFLQQRGFLGTTGVDKGYFGASTSTALAQYQSSVGISPVDGFFGPMSRVKVSTDCASGLKGALPSNYATSDSVFVGIDLQLGISHQSVITLQKFLNSRGYTVESVSGQPGSIGYESNYFGEKTRQALIKFQKDKGISPAQGYFGPKTRSLMGL